MGGWMGVVDLNTPVRFWSGAVLEFINESEAGIREHANMTLRCVGMVFHLICKKKKHDPPVGEGAVLAFIS